jgi:type IV pilus assembly protein PilA
MAQPTASLGGGVRQRTKRSTTIIVAAAAFGSIVLIGILAAIAWPAYQDYTKRAKVSQGIRMGDALRLRIAEAYEQRAPDLSCSAEACRLYGAAPASAKHVKRISSDRTGAILIEYDEHSFPPAKNTLSITPWIDGKTADLSDPANAGKSLTWKCGQDALTTVAARYRPSTCK